MKKIVFYTLANGKKPVAGFIKSLSDQQAEKIVFVLELIETMKSVPRKFLKKLKATDDLWEVRIQSGNNIFRLLGFLDGDELLILNHAFTKKTQKTPRKEIKKAERRKKDYFTQRGHNERSTTIKEKAGRQKS